MKPFKIVEKATKQKIIVLDNNNYVGELYYLIANQTTGKMKELSISNLIKNYEWVI